MSAPGTPAAEPGRAELDPNRKVTNIGVVGCGAIAQVVHLPILSQMENARIGALCDADLAKARTVAERFDVPAAYGSIGDLLEQDDIEAVVICTPNYLHSGQCEEALRAGRHILCERPLALDRPAVSRLLATANQAGLHLLVAHNHRYRPDAQALRTAIADGELGDVFHVHASWYRRRTRRPRRQDWRRDPAQAGGGVLMDLGVQTLDLGLWLLGYPRPERVLASVVARDPDGVEDSAAVMLGFASRPLTLSMEVTWELVAKRDLHVVRVLGSEGSGHLSPFTIHVGQDRKIVDVTPTLPSGTENVYTASYRRELDHFLAVVAGDAEEPLPTEQEVLMGVTDACYASARQGREIVL